MSDPRPRVRSKRSPVAMLHSLEVYQAELLLQNDELRAANEELRRTNESLETASARFRALYQRAPTPYVSVDAARMTVDINHAGEVILDTPRDRLIGGMIDRFVATADRAGFRALVDAAFEGLPTSRRDILMLGADAAMIDAMVEGVLLDGVAPDPSCCVLAIVDITARKQAETLRRRAQDEILAIVSHDLRGPLNAIDLACDALTAVHDSHDYRRYLETIVRSSARCERLIKDLLRVAQIESGCMRLAVEVVDLCELLRQVCRDHELAASAAGSKLDLSVGTVQAMIFGDRDRLHQVFANLIGNALVHARGSAIEVSVGAREREAVVVVSDNGPGIPSGELSSVFDRYRQGGRHSAGAGLGLAIVKGIVEAHGGAAVVTSQLGHGARFEIAFPVTQQAHESPVSGGSLPTLLADGKLWRG